MIEIIRVSYSADGTFGVLLENGFPFAVTAEEVWRGNKLNISCIPAGRYYCERASYKGKYESFLLQDTEPRTGIFFHIGNNIRDTEGCILVGERLGLLKGKPAILYSQSGFSQFMDHLHGIDEFMLTIREAV